MRSLLLGVMAAFLIPSANLRGQETDPEDSTSSQPAARRVTALMGVGNDLGWLGGQVEAYFSGDRLSAFVGLGYTPEIDTGDPTGVTPAGGVRAYTAGSNHRVFGEASVSQSPRPPPSAVGITDRASRWVTSTSPTGGSRSSSQAAREWRLACQNTYRAATLSRW